MVITTRFFQRQLGLLLVFLAVGCSKYADPLSPEETLASFQLDPAFEINLFAAEPFIKDPVCMEFDEDGNIYVVEMYDYPYRPEEGKEQGRIMLLKDEDGDGVVDQSIVFADKLMEATSILPWDGGLLVTSAPHILYLKDTDDDQKADVKQELFSGFFAANSEAQITSLRFGADNWIYASNNGRAGEVSSTMNPQAAALDMRGADFRFRMDTILFEQITGSGQFGQDLDEYGNRYYTQNSRHIQQSIMPWKYWHRHEHMPSFSTSENIVEYGSDMFQLTPPPYWRAERTKRRNEDFQARNLDRIEYAEDKITGASGGTIYTGNAFGEAHTGNVFTGDVAGNLIRRDILVENSRSPAMIAKRAQDEVDREFLASTDPWFRPTNFAQGPDGLLYVLDYYRQHIETPLSIPDDLKEEMDFMNGSDMGRIYRIQPKGADPASSEVMLSEAGSSELVQLLSHENGWHRSTAQRLLLERQDLSVVDEIRSVLETSNSPSARIRALYLLDGLRLLGAADVQVALSDSQPGIRKAGLILSETLDYGLDLVLPLAMDEHPHVAFQAALTLGNYEGEVVEKTLADLLVKWGENEWFGWAVLSSEVGSSEHFLSTLSTKGYLQDIPDYFLRNYANISGLKADQAQIGYLLEVLTNGPVAQNEKLLDSALKGLLRGSEQAGLSELTQEIKAVIEGNETAIDKTQRLSVALSASI